MMGLLSSLLAKEVKISKKCFVRLITIMSNFSEANTFI